MKTDSSHITDDNARLAELNSGLLALERERVSLLSASLAAAQVRVAALEVFIGAISSPGVAVAVASVSAPKAPKRAKEKASKKPTGKKPAGEKKARAARGSASGGDRVDDLVAAVKAAGKDGISARKVGEQTGIPYTAVRSIIATSGKFVQKGEKRASRVFLK